MRHVVVSVLLMVWTTLAASALPLPARHDLVDFEMQDQFRQTHRGADYRGRVLVVIGSDKHASGFNGAWGQAIYDSLFESPGYETIAFLRVADLRGVPFFLKGYVRGKFPQEREKWVLTDWAGEFARTYSWTARESNTLVFGPDGRLLYHGHGTTVRQVVLDPILIVLRDLLGDDGTDSREDRASDP